MKDIYVVTHTESRHHVEGRVGGWYDTGLTAAGQAQARQVARRLGELLGSRPPRRIVTSDLRRTAETASAIAQELACPIETTPDLREMSFGVAEGKPQAWLDERFVPAPDSDRLDHRSIAGGESKREMVERIYRGAERIFDEDHPSQVIVTHGFALTFVIACWIRMPIESAGFVNFRATPGGITHLREDERFHNRAVRSLNDVAHLG